MPAIGGWSPSKASFPSAFPCLAGCLGFAASALAPANTGNAREQPGLAPGEGLGGEKSVSRGGFQGAQGLCLLSLGFVFQILPGVFYALGTSCAGLLGGGLGGISSSLKVLTN